MKMKSIGEELALVIRAGQEDDRLVWREPSCVQVLITKIIPDGPKQTVEVRRRKLREALSASLSSEGWTISRNWIVCRQEM
jgi:hypothetical protein